MKVRFYFVKGGNPIVDEVAKILGVEKQISGVNVVSWIIEGGVLSPSDLPDVEKELTEKIIPNLDSSKPIILSGRGPLWLYSMLVHNVHYFRVVATWEPRVKRGIIIEGPREILGRPVDLSGNIGEDVSLGAKGTLHIRTTQHTEKNIQVIHIEVKNDRFIEPRIIRDLELKDNLNSNRILVVEGMMPVWLASYITAQLVHHVPALAFYDPRLKKAVVTATHTLEVTVGQLLDVEDLIKKKESIVIGILGHPNSGKSVFLHLLNNILRSKGFSTLTQEADLIAPTQHWSLFQPEIRKELKKHMSPEERLKWVVNALKNAKESGSLDVVLADIGGGKPSEGELITKENAAILQRVDAVVIVSREGIEEWLKQLSLYVPHVKIIAMLESSLKGKAIFDKYTRSGRVVMLDRNLFVENRIPRDTIEVVEKVADLILRRNFISIEKARMYFEEWRGVRNERKIRVGSR